MFKRLPHVILPLILATLAGCQSTGSTQASGKKSNEKSGGLSSALSLVSAAAGSVGSSSGDGKTDHGLALGAATDTLKAVTLSDADVIKGANDAIKELDHLNKIAPAGNKYAVRLNKLFSKHKKEDGMALDYKVYLVRDVNAFAMANGSVRVFAGLMDKFSDDELLFVIGHEVGHVKLQHSKDQLRAAMLTSAVRKGVASQNTALGDIAAGRLGALAEAAMNAKFSRTDETAADDYSLQFLAKHKYKLAAAESALKKLGESGDNTTFLSSHPASSERAQHMVEKIKTLVKG